MKINFKGSPVTLVGTQVKVGSKAPDFELTDNKLATVKLSDFKNKVVVLSIFPSIDTGVCAMQTRNFNKKVSELPGGVIISISKDLPFAQARFCGAEGVDKLIMLSDYKANDFGDKYGFLIKELGLLARGVIVINKQGVIEYIEILNEVADEPNYDKALKIAIGLL